MMKVFLKFILFITIPTSAFSQNQWQSWNDNYKPIVFEELMKSELAYADTIEKSDMEEKYYLRMDTYRFMAFFTGELRPLADSTRSSMKRVYRMLGNRDYLWVIDEIKYAYQFKIEDKNYWFAMQSNLDKAFKKEMKKPGPVYLYCLFLNEHELSGTLHNTFLVSEFIKQ
jgi:hypothetical protein